MMFAIMTKTPLPMVWDLGLGVILRYMRRSRKLLPLINPLAVPAEDEEPAITDPKKIRALAKSMGIKGA